MQPLRALSSVLLSLTLATASPVPESAVQISDNAQMLGRNMCLYSGNQIKACSGDGAGVCCTGDLQCPSGGGCAAAGVCYYNC
ncbi:hypothetical protein IG631_00366 [Alternaria alternata]|nr:hypothetical protein IG631_00366 [Alternaria alternata]